MTHPYHVPGTRVQCVQALVRSRSACTGASPLPPGSCFLNAEALSPPLAGTKGPQMLSQIYLLQSQINNNSTPAPPCPNGRLMLLQGPEPPAQCSKDVGAVMRFWAWWGHPFLPPNTAILSYSCHSLVKPGT